MTDIEIKEATQHLKELQEQHIKLKIRGRKNYVLKLIGETLINSFLEDEKQKMIYEMSDDEIVELVDKKFSVKKETAKTKKIETSELTKKDAKYLYGNWRIGLEQLVKNKDGKMFFVDHSYSGKLIKTEGRWEDAKYGFDENVFVPCNRLKKTSIVSWCDEQPLNINKYLNETGWFETIQKEDEFSKMEWLNEM